MKYAIIGSGKILHLGQQAHKFLENLAASQREFEPLRRSDQKVNDRTSPVTRRGLEPRRCRYH
jgi:hypothetical protein